MLSKLIISNVALIKHLELDFCDKLNILSGETGAGKSIIVDSLMLLLGERYDKTILRFNEESGYVEGVFSANAKSLKVLEDFGFEKDELIIINRKFNLDGKNEIRINGRQGNMSMLRQITGVLVDIYGQNEYQSFAKNSEHLRILQYYVRHTSEEILKKLSEEYFKYYKINKELTELGNLAERERNIDMLKFQIDEITKAKISSDEEEILLEKRKKIVSAEKIALELNATTENLSLSETASAQSLIANALSSLGSITSISSEYQELYNRLDSVNIELTDISETLNDYLSDIDFDPSELETTEQRLDKIRNIKRKYGDFEQISKFLSDSKEKLFKLENSSAAYDNLTNQKTSCMKIIYDLSLKLSNIRKNGALKFESLIEKELSDLGMNGAKFKIVFEDFPTFDNCEKFISANGMDKLEFYLSANAGQPLKPLTKIISGGEMSRFILSIKVVSSQTDDIPTMIFDEIDTGISGKIGQEVAKKLAIISRSHQILCVTHLPQIASMADNHYYINKITANNETLTDVTLLNDNAMVEEISRLSGAKDISLQSAENARQMKYWSDEFKKLIKS